MKPILLFLYLIITLLTPTLSYSKTLQFPDDLDEIYKKWEGMTDIQKSEFLKEFKGDLISGSGKIISIEDGGSFFGCKGSRHTKFFGKLPNCYQVSVMRVRPECSLKGLENLDVFGIEIPGAKECPKLHTTELYFNKKEKAELLKLNKGEILNYHECKLVRIVNLFYSEVHCDASFFNVMNKLN